MVMKRVILSLLLMISAISFAQIDKSMVATEDNLQNISRSASIVMTTDMDELYEGIRGTPYLFTGWRQGNIYLKDSSQIKNINIKYNIYTDDVLYLNSKSGDSLIIERSLIREFQMLNDSASNIITFKEMNMKPGNDGKSTFVKVLYDSKSEFLMKYIKVFIKADYKGAYTAGRKYDEYTDDLQYYILKDNNELNKIKLGKKAVIKVLAEKENKIKSFIDQQGLTLDNENDVIKVLDYYDSITD